MKDRSKSEPNILVVDDEVLVCQSIKMLLRDKGIEVHAASSVKEAVEMVEKISFDLFLIDKNLPGEDGFVFMDYLLKTESDIPFVMMTGNASINSAVLALRKGAYDYLQKPFKYEELVNVVSHALGEKQLKDQNRMITEMLNNSERRYREMIQSSPDLIIMLDSHGAIFFVNETFTSMLGYSVEEVKGVPFTSIVDKKYVDIVNSFLGLTISVHETDSSSGIDVEILCAPDCASERKTMDIEIRKSNLSFNRNDSNNSYGTEEICIVGRDIGFRKAFEQQMIYSQKMEAVAVLAGGVAHDFNNLLMGIQGYVSVVKSALGVNHSCYKKMVAIEKNVVRGSTLTAQLLNFARGGISNIQSVNLNYVLKDTLELFSINRKKIQIHLDLSKDLWEVQVDACQMEQVFLNMFLNADHAMESGGDIFIKTENLILHGVDAKQMKVKPGLYVKISIRDTGHGIDEKLQKKIFDPFFSTRKKSEGAGLGLASAYGIVKKHNGIINVSSASGEGALFTIYLCVKVENTCVESETSVKRAVERENIVSITPETDHNVNMMREARRSIQNAALDLLYGAGAVRGIDESSAFEKLKEDQQNRDFFAQSGRGRPMTALIIDDEPVVKEMVVAMLRKMGVHTVVACSGREGVQKYMEHLDGIDLVLLDMVMPGMSGSETFRYIRKLNPDARILIASGYRNQSEIDSMIAEGGCDFLKKPYDIEILYDRISSLLEMRSDGTVSFPGFS